MPRPSSEALAFTEKELETAGAAQELLDAPTIGGGVPGLGWWWGSQRSQISLPSRLEYSKTVPKWSISHTH
jgi:hypothetical protein